MNAAASVPAVKQAKRRSAFPTLPLYSAFAFIGFAVAAVVFGQKTGIGTLKTEDWRPVAIADITIRQEGENGTVTVADADTGRVLAQYADGEGGFVSGSVRGLSRMRLVADAPAEAPYRLIRWENGAVSLSDTATGQRIYLNAFGPDNVAAFAKFLDMNGRTAQ